MMWRQVMGCAILLAVAVPLGCAVDQQKEVAQYRQVLELADEPETIDVGQTLSLRQAMLLANRHNERLAIEGENFVQALIDKRRAVAGFLPTVELSPTYSFQDSSGLPRGTSSDQLTVNLGGNINLFNGFRDQAAVREAAATIEERRNLLLNAQQTLLLDVARMYYQVLRSERLVTVLQDSLAVQEERVRQQEAQQRVGMKISLDVAQTRAQASATRVQLTNARNDVANGRALLAFLTGAPVENCVLTDEFALPQEVEDVAVWLEVAGQQRHDLLAAEAAVEASRQGVRVAFGQYYPSVALNLNAILYRDPDTGGADWTGLVRANLPIFSAGRIEADVREAWSEFRSAAAEASLLRRQVQQEVRVAYQDLMASRQRLNELQTQLLAAEEAFRQAEGLYNAGTATNLERITALNELLNAQLQLASEQYNQKVFYLNLMRAAGAMRAGEQVAIATTRPVPTTDPAATTIPAAVQTPRLVPTTRP